MKLKTLKPYIYFRYDLDEFNNDTENSKYPLYRIDYSWHKGKVAYIVVDMAWSDSYFIAGTTDAIPLPKNDWSNRIVPFEISPLVTREDLKRLSQDAVFFTLVRRIYAGCSYENDFKACYYNEDAKKAITAARYHLKKIQVERPPEYPFQFYEEIIQKLKETQMYEPWPFEIKLRLREDYMPIMPENSHLIKAERFLCPYSGFRYWPRGVTL